MKGGKNVSAKGSKTSSHVVSFRLSNEAYRGLLRVSNNLTGSTPSELAREMVFAYLETDGDVEELALSLAIRRLDGSLVGLIKEVKQLSAAVTKKAARPSRKSPAGKPGKKHLVR
jgi:predicted DNA-binding protein